MLSRVADSLYWMSRYLERAKHTARMLNVHLHESLDRNPDRTREHWERVFRSLEISPPAEWNPLLATRVLAFDPSNRSSIWSSVSAARENARQVREQISSEMWLQLNRLYLRFKDSNLDSVWKEQPHEFFHDLIEDIFLFNGITASTMNHGEGWHFIQLGRFLERATATATLLNEYFASSSALDPLQGDGYLEWIGLLKSCTAFEPYCRVYTADIRPERIAEFLLLNPESPHSITFAVNRIQVAAQSLVQRPSHGDHRKPNKLLRLAGKLKATLSFSHIEELMEEGLGPALQSIQRQCDHIHDALHQTHIAYPVHNALVN